MDHDPQNGFINQSLFDWDLLDSKPCGELFDWEALDEQYEEEPDLMDSSDDEELGETAAAAVEEESDGEEVSDEEFLQICATAISNKTGQSVDEVLLGLQNFQF